MQATTWHLPGARRNVAPCLVGSDGVQILHDGFLIGFLARMHLVRPAALDRDAQAGRAASKPWPPLSRPSPVSPRGGNVLQRSSPSGSSPSCRRGQNHQHRALEGADAGLAAERAAAPSLASGRRAWTARILATRLTAAGETGRPSRESRRPVPQVGQNLALRSAAGVARRGHADELAGPSTSTFASTRRYGSASRP